MVEIDLTPEQLYFYSYSFSFCYGPYLYDFKYDSHPSLNIRGNIIVNLPEFNEAFNCPENSRMMKSQTEECIIFGPDAPQTKFLN
ncbi:unnamed protein product [Caenorhabditis bovis]|uniref:Peptidase M13 C-terminal domain-containing protein n=1 Tax=Caenorhabditis bovis TaxID=2654633 RepID=A0A8S1EN03_9PELO|nr:unnamed protein product [Caenorhabditis bovis]